MSDHLQPPLVLEGLKQLASQFEGLRGALNSEAYQEITVKTWLKLLHIEGMTQTQFDDAVTCALLLHTERNLTFAHFRAYRKRSRDLPQISKDRTDPREQRFIEDQEDAESKSVEGFNVWDEIQKRNGVRV